MRTLLLSMMILSFHQLNLTTGPILLTYKIYVYHIIKKIYPQVNVYYFLFIFMFEGNSCFIILYIILVLEYPTSRYLIKTIEECYYKALYYIGSSLSGLQYFKNDKDIMVCMKLLAYKKITNVWYKRLDVHCCSRARQLERIICQVAIIHPMLRTLEITSGCYSIKKHLIHILI